MKQSVSTTAMAILAIVVLHACVFSVGGWRSGIARGCCAASHGISRQQLVANSDAADGNHCLHLSAPSDIEELSCSDADDFLRRPT
jgi:hypothetical protein